MKKYTITVIGATQTKGYEIIASSFGSNSGYYAFYNNNELISCFPINRTIIESITKL
jgi:hypothetical protein